MILQMRAKVKVVHKLSNSDWTKCGIALYAHGSTVAKYPWKKVTCKRCLRGRPKK